MEELIKQLKRLKRIEILLFVVCIILCIILCLDLLIAITTSHSGCVAGNEMSNQDKQIYNSMIKRYIGENKRGTDVKLMIEEVINQNDQYVNESRKFISIKIAEGTEIQNLKTGNEDDTTGKTLKKACDKANIFEGGENTQENINAAKNEMRQLKKAISSGKTYNISIEDGNKSGEKEGIIHTVYIKENK